MSIRWPWRPRPPASSQSSGPRRHEAAELFGPDTPRVGVLSRAGCGLCVEAEAVVRAVCGDAAIEFLVRDLDEAAAEHGWGHGDPRFERWTEQVPVVFVDGVVVAVWRVDEAALRRALNHA